MKKILTFLINVIVVLAIFFVGFLYGKQSIPAEILVDDVENKAEGKPQNVDFGIFWEAWRMINNTYVAPEELDATARVYGAIKGMIDSIDDPYSTFFTPEESEDFQESLRGKFEGIGAEIGIRNDVLTIIAPLRDSPAERSGLLAGDRVLAIGDKSAASMSLEEAVTLIRGEKGTAVVLTVLHEARNEPTDIRIVRDTINIPAIEYEVLEGNIGYIEALSFNEQLQRDFQTIARRILTSDVRGLIVDVRNNPGGRLDIAIDFTGWFVDEGDTVVIERGRDPKDEIVHKAQGPARLSALPIIVLINEGSASASEIFAGALRDLRNARLVGEQTFGKGSVQVYQSLPDRSSIKITTALWFTPAGDSINDEGLAPTIEVEMVPDVITDQDGNETPVDPEDDVDEQLQRAIELLQAQFE